jgi:glutathione S-transferase
LSLADLHAAPMIVYFTQAAEGAALLGEYPSLQEWWRRLAIRESMAKTRFAGEN